MPRVLLLLVTVLIGVEEPMAGADADRAASAAPAAGSLSFSDLPGWETVDPRSALAALAAHCRRPAEAAHRAPLLDTICPRLPQGLDAAGARLFLERTLRPVRLSDDGTGFLTGYYEPEVAASPVPTDAFRHPLLARPDDLVAVGEAAWAAGFPRSLAFARRKPDGTLAPYPDRAAILADPLDGRRAIAWLADPVDAFFIHIQGSARLVLPDGSVRRVGYAGKSGHPYTPIGRVLVERGAMARDAVSADAIRNWLAGNPEEAAAVMNENRSYIFFRDNGPVDPATGPVAAAGVPLTPLVSIATDPRHIPYGTPVFIAGDLPLADPDADGWFATLAVAEDTGSAIVGPARADLFVGSGAAAGLSAGRIKHRVAMIGFAPRTEADRAAAGGDPPDR